jgi:hypothetical protein
LAEALDKTQLTLFLPPNKDILHQALSCAKEVLQDISKERKFETYLELHQQAKKMRNPHHRDFLFAVMEFLWPGLSEEQKKCLTDVIGVSKSE